MHIAQSTITFYVIFARLIKNFENSLGSILVCLKNILFNFNWILTNNFFLHNEFFEIKFYY